MYLLIFFIILLTFVAEHPSTLCWRTARKFGHDISVRRTFIVQTLEVGVKNSVG